MSGISYETPYNQVTDPTNEPPLKLGGRQSDYLTGYTAAASAMSALAARRQMNKPGWRRPIYLSLSRPAPRAHARPDATQCAA